MTNLIEGRLNGNRPKGRPIKCMESILKKRTPLWAEVKKLTPNRKLLDNHHQPNNGWGDDDDDE